MLNINRDSYKIGVEEIEGLADAMRAVLKPVHESIKDRVYWNDCDIESTEYKSRDGFIPFSSNFGGMEISVIIPKCEKYEFLFLEFGECDECGKADEYPEGDHQCGYCGMECSAESEGHLDAKLRVWLKFEGLDEETGEMSFYLYCGGGNGDAPYFRTKYEHDVFSAEFTCKSPFGLKRAAAPHIAKLLEAIK